MSLRPSILDPLFAPVTALPGVGPKLAPALDRLVGEPGRPARIVDLLFHLPQGAVSRELKGSVAEAPVGEPLTLAVRVAAHRPGPPNRARAPYRVLVEDDTGDVTLVFFNLPPRRIEQMLPIGARRLVSGTIELYDGHRQMVHPARVVDETASDPNAVEAVYGLTEGVSSRLVAKYVGQALDRLPEFPEWQDRDWLVRGGFPPFSAALRSVHRPDAGPRQDGPAQQDPARQRLAFDELLASQLALALVRHRARRLGGRSLVADGALRARIVDALPFRPTGAQERALGEIRGDLASDSRRSRRSRARSSASVGRSRSRATRPRSASSRRSTSRVSARRSPRPKRAPSRSAPMSTSACTRWRSCSASRPRR